MSLFLKLKKSEKEEKMKSKAITTMILFLAGIFILAFDVVPVAAASDDSSVGVWHLDKEFGTALSFDGIDDYVAVPDSTILEPSNVTVEAWVKRLGSPGTYKYIVGKHYGPGWNSYGLYTRTSGGLWFYIGTGITYYPSPDAGAGVWDGNWHHVAGTFDGSYVRLYVDGNEVGTGTLVPSGTSIAYDGAGVNIGVPGDPWIGGPYHFDGVIDEVRISNVARTSFDLFTPLTVDSDTVALWHFNEGDGQSVYDATGNGNDGQLGSISDPDDNDPTWVDSTVNSTLAIDSSSNENHGTIYGATWTTGVFDDALEFDGVDDYVSVLDTDSLDCSSAITIEAWIYVKNYPSSIDGSILSKRWAYYFVIIPDGKIRAYTYGTTPQTWFSSNTSVPLNEWTHVAFTYDGEKIKIYINGELDSSSPRTGYITITEEWAAIGRVGIKGGAEIICCGPRAFEGIIDEVRIWDQALTAEEVYTCYKSKRKVLPIAGPIIWTSAFKVPKVGASLVTIYIWPSDPSVEIDYVDYNPKMAFTPKNTNGYCVPELPQDATLPYSITITVVSETCKTMHLWLYLSTGEHVGVNVQFR